MFRWVRDNPDRVAVMHALRFELTVRHVMSNVGPSDDENPFMVQLRFEWGSDGNRNAHGQATVDVSEILQEKTAHRSC